MSVRAQSDCVFLKTLEKENPSPFHLQCCHGWRGCSFRGDESEVSVSRGGEKLKPLLLSSRFVPPPVSRCWAS